MVFPDYLLNHIQRCDWRGARPHLELIAADATHHKEMGCRGVDGVGWGSVLAGRTKPRELFTLSDTQLRSCNEEHPF